MSKHDHTRGGCDGSSRGSLSRRGFLGLASAAAAAQIGYSELEDTLFDPAVADTVLTEGDLVGQDSYVEWQIDAVRAPLPAHLRRTVPSFDGRGAVTGYVSDGTRGLPKYVESAVFTGEAWGAITDATAEWFADTHANAPTVTRRDRDRVAWHATTREGIVDAIHLDRVAGLVAITVVGGRPTGLDPRTAARRYGTAVRERAQL